jgi:site-specific DNA-cytosine methylase
MNYKVLGISSAMGVSLYPFKKELIGNIEARPIFHSPGDRQWKVNFGNIPLLREITTAIEKPDIIISSPDCGSGSILRMSRAKEYGDHKKNDSLKLFFEAMDLYKPKLFLFENLEGLFKSFPEEDFDKALQEYHLIKHIAPVTMWGNSQATRVRLIIVGIRKDIYSKKLGHYFRMPDYRHLNKTCWELYGDLDKIGWSIPFGNVRENIYDACTIHSGRKLLIQEIQNIWQTELRSQSRWVVKDRNYSTAPGVYRNLPNHYPSTARKANRQFDHNGLMLTPRQLARIQGVPDSFRLYVTSDKLNYWINKARAAVTKTPPYEIGLWFKKKIDKSQKLWTTKHSNKT